MLSEIGFNSQNRSSPAFGFYTYVGPHTQRAGPRMGHAETSQPVRKKKKHRNNDILWYSAAVVPSVRRVSSVPQRMEDGNNIGAGLQIGLAALNFFGDLREMELAGDQAAQLYKAAKNGVKSGKGLGHAGKQVMNVFTGKGLPAAQRFQGQHAMTLFGGTVIEPLFEKIPILKKLNEWDAPLYETGFGKWLRKNFDINIDKSKPGLIKRFPIKIPFTKIEIKPTNQYIQAYNFKGGYFKQLTGRSLYRLSKLGLVTAAALELPLLVQSITKTEGTLGDKAKAFGKQLIKSTAFVGVMNGAMAVGGAMLAPFGAIPSLIGMAIGSGGSLVASKAFNKQVDNIFKSKTELS